MHDVVVACVVYCMNSCYWTDGYLMVSLKSHCVDEAGS